MNPLIQKHKLAIEDICKKLQVKKLYIFGSGAGNNLKSDSDLDFILVFNDELTTEKYADNYFLLHQKFEKLFIRKIDLITEGSLSNPFFIESINSTKKLIYDESEQKISV